MAYNILVTTIGQFIKGASLLIHVAHSDTKPVKVPYHHPQPFDAAVARKIAKPLGLFGASTLDGLDADQIQIGLDTAKQAPIMVRDFIHNTTKSLPSILTLACVFQDSLMAIPTNYNNDRRCCVGSIGAAW